MSVRGCLLWQTCLLFDSFLILERRSAKCARRRGALVYAALFSRPPRPECGSTPLRRSHSVGPAATGRRSRGASGLTIAFAATARRAKPGAPWLAESLASTQTAGRLAAQFVWKEESGACPRALSEEST